MKSLILFALLASVQVFAGNIYLDGAWLSDCGGRIELYRAYNGDVSLELKGVDTYRCDKLKFYDVSSGRTIKTYNIQGTSYTLSKSQERSLSEDCRLGVQLYDSANRRYINDTLQVKLNFWSCLAQSILNPRPVYPNEYNYDYPSYHNDYSNGNHSHHGYITYEWSRKHHCKMMVNGQFERLVEDYKCR